MYHRLSDISYKEPIPGFKVKFVHGEAMTTAFWEIEKGAVLPEHSHIHEQIAIAIEGEFELTIDGKKQICKPGSVTIIPSQIPHSGRALTACEITDIFSPVREDYK